MSDPSLYGIENSNRSGDDLWGKNQFNSTFPVALCCYMRDCDIPPVYIAVNSNFSSRTTDSEISITDVFGTDATGDQVKFDFESVYEPADPFTYDDLEAIDLVTRLPNGEPLKPLEIKLTVVPDNSTARLSQDKWSPELVVRPITSAYATIQIARRIVSANLDSHIRSLVEPLAQRIQDWNNQTEILSIIDETVETLKLVSTSVADLQAPFLIQPIWKTVGKSPQLAENCFDVFVWSDLAIWKLIIDSAAKRRSGSLSRSQRECARTLRCLYGLITVGRVSYSQIYRGMDLGNQTDKAFALGGRVTSTYMRHPRLEVPAMTSKVLRALILNGGEAKLSPERRFDATVYFTWGGLTTNP